MTSVFGRHGREFARAIRRQEWERAPEGVRFPRQDALLFGEFEAHTDRGVVSQRNIITDYGLAVLGDTASASSGLLSAPSYIAPFGADATPAHDWTVFDLLIAEELGDAPEGYSQASRVAWTVANEGSKIIGNTASPSAFTLRTASSIDVYGFALVLDPAKRSAMTASFYDITSQTFDEIPPIDPVTTSFGVLRTGTAGGNGYVWLDPDGADVYDGGVGNWTDPGGDDLQMSFGYDVYARTLPYANGGVIAAARFSGAPLSFANLDPLNVVYRMRLA